VHFAEERLACLEKWENSPLYKEQIAVPSGMCGASCKAIPANIVDVDERRMRKMRENLEQQLVRQIIYRGSSFPERRASRLVARHDVY
jgi:hypothetical protein